MSDEDMQDDKALAEEKKKEANIHYKVGHSVGSGVENTRQCWS